MAGEAFQRDVLAAGAVVGEGAEHRPRGAAPPPQIAAGRLLRSGLDLRDENIRLLEAGDEAHAPGEGQLDLELAAHQLLRQLLLPAQEREQIAFDHHRHGAVLDKLDGQWEVAGGDGVMDRFAPHLACRVPAIGAAMQLIDLLALLGAQPVDQKLAQQMVIAVPVAVLVERHEQELLALEGFEDRGAVGCSGDCAAQRAVHLAENRRLQQKVDDGRRLGSEGVLEVLGNGA